MNDIKHFCYCDMPPKLNSGFYETHIVELRVEIETLIGKILEKLRYLKVNKIIESEDKGRGQWKQAKLIEERYVHFAGIGGEGWNLT